MIRAVLFDATGTLLAPADPVGETYARVAARHGAPLPAWRLGDAFARIHASSPPPVFPGTPTAELPARERAWWRAVVRGTLRAADGTARVDDFEAFFDELFRFYAGAGAWRQLPGARQALTALRKRGLRTAVVSNFDGRLRGILDGLGLSPLLDAVVLPSDAGAAKPDPAIFLCALEALACAPGEAVFVGDDAHRDLAAARSLGIAALDATSLATLAELPSRLDVPR